MQNFDHKNIRRNQSEQIDSMFVPINSKFAEKKKDAKILLVDDEDYNLTALKIILKYHIKVDVDKFCDEAVNGKEAFEAVKNNVINNNWE